MKKENNLKFKKLKSEDEEILENIKWFLKFPLEKRLEISELDTKTVLELRSLKIESNEE